MEVVAVIPARYSSTRLEGKLLRTIAGKPLILHTWEQARRASSVSRVIIATDDERIFRVAADAGANAVMTSSDHRSGTDRIAEVAVDLPEGTVVVNIQGDEPLIAPETIDGAVSAYLEGDCDIATVYELFSDADAVLSPDNVKVVTDARGFAIYFSRAPVPFPRDAAIANRTLHFAIEADLTHYRKHSGLYVYSREFLLNFNSLPQSVLERVEMLEQLRALENGARIRVVRSEFNSVGVDTAEDLRIVAERIEGASA